MFKKSLFFALSVLMVSASYSDAQLLRRGRQQVVGYQYYQVPVRQQQNCPNNYRYQPRQQTQRVSPQQYQAMLQQRQQQNCQARQMQMQYQQMAERQAMMQYQQQYAGYRQPIQVFPVVAQPQPQVAQAKQPVELKGEVEPIPTIPDVEQQETVLASGESPIEILAPGESGLTNEGLIPEILPEDIAPAIEPPLEGSGDSILESVIEGNEK